MILYHIKNSKYDHEIIIHINEGIDGTKNYLENKDYKVNVDIAEIKKFIRDINEQKTHGIFLSQFSGIVSKPNFFIEIQDGKVLLYLHNVEYNSDKINTAVSIIDNLSTKLSDINDSEEENGFSILYFDLE